MENNKNKKSVKFQGDMLNFYDFIQVFVFTTNHHLNNLLMLYVAGNVCNDTGIKRYLRSTLSETCGLSSRHMTS